jgi:hypothetical protein
MDFHAPEPAAGVDVVAFEGGQRLLAAELGEDGALAFGANLRGDEFPDGAADHLLRGKAEEGAFGLVDETHVAIQVDFVISEGSGGKTFLARIQSFPPILPDRRRTVEFERGGAGWGIRGRRFRGRVCGGRAFAFVSVPR